MQDTFEYYMFHYAYYIVHQHNNRVRYVTGNGALYFKYFWKLTCDLGLFLFRLENPFLHVAFCQAQF